MDSDENCIKFVNSIKKKYQCRNVDREKQWPPCHSNKLIRLELVEKEKLLYAKDENNCLEPSNKNISRTPLAYADLLNVKKGEKTVKRILVTGSAGIGKTTLCVSISEDWANGLLFQQFKLLLLLPLRHKKVSAAGSILDLLKLLHSSKKMCDSIFSYLEEEEGEEVLIIADGWDELDKHERQEESFMYQLLTGELLPFASVIVTSRSSASLALHEFMDRFVEVLGFNKKNIEEFIQSEFASEHEKAIDLSRQLESNPLIESVCSIPLNCAIVCHLWRTLKEDLPTTMTELYTKLALNFTLRNIRKLDSYKEIKSLSDFNSFPEGLQQSWWLLCKFAFLALIKNQILFSQEDLSKFFPEDTTIRNILLFGLLQPAESILETGYGLSFHFLHLTFQEYLAAMHLAKNPLIVCYNQLHELDPGVDLSSIPAIFYAMTSNFTVFWRFFFGIYFQESRECNEEPDMNMVSQHLSAMTEYVGDNNLYFWHCAFEAQNETIASNVVRLTMDSEDGIHHGIIFNDTVVIESHFSDVSTAHDCAAVIYLITHFQSLGNITINFSECGIGENQIRTLTDALVTKHGKLQVNGLDLEGNSLTDESVSNLFQRAAVAFKSLKRLILKSNRIGVESTASILTRSPCNTLSTLDLSHNPLGVLSLHTILDAIRGDVLIKLQWLNLVGSLTSEAGTNITIFCDLLNAIVSHCPRFSSLDLSLNNFGTPETSGNAIATMSQDDGELQIYEIDLAGSKITDKYASEIFQRAATVLHSLVTLILSNNMVEAESIKSIATVLARSPCNRLSTLDLSHNPLGVPGLQALEDAIHSGLLTKLERLNLQESLTTDADINGALLTTLLDVLSINCPKLVKLALSHNNLGVPGASALARVIPHLVKGREHRSRICSSSEFGIYLNDTMLGDDGFTALVNTQERQHHVDVLSLKNNDIHADRILWLVDDSGDCPNFQEFFSTFNLSSNPLGIEGVVAIGKMLTSSFCHLRELFLSNCQLTTKIKIDCQPSSSFLSIGTDTRAAVKYVGQQLYQMHQNSTIKNLVLSENNLSGEGIHVLSGFLYLCKRLVYLNIRQCQINSNDLKLLLKQLTELKSSSCTDLKVLNIDDNKLNDSGVSALLDHLSSLFHSLNYLYIDGNPVSNRMMRRANMEILKHIEVRKHLHEPLLDVL